MEKLSIGVLIGASIASQFSSTMSSVSGRLQSLGKLSREISAKQVKLTGLDKAGAEAKTAFAAFEQAKKRVDDLRRAMEQAARTNDLKGWRNYRDDLHFVESAMQKARTTLDKKQEAFRKAKGAVQEAGLSVSNYKNQLGSLSAELDKVTLKQTRLNNVVGAKGRFTERMGKLRNAAMGAAAVGGSVVAGMIAPAMQFEDAMLGVAKQVDGARDSNGKLTSTYFEMKDEIRAMGREIPIATNEIAVLVEQAARMGVQGKDNLLTFTKTTAKMATAFDMPAEEIGNQMGKIAGLFKIPASGMEALGDSINYLDDNAKSTGREIIDVMMRMGGAAETLGMSAGHAAALGSTFVSLGESAERAGTAGEGMLRQLSIAKMNPKRFQIGAQMIGMTGAEINKGMSSDAQGTILKVLEKIKALPKENQMEAVTRLFGKDWGGAIAKLANNIDEYKRQIELATGKDGQGSMQREFEARKQTLSAQWQTFKNQLGDVVVPMGEALFPAIKSLGKELAPVLLGLANFAKEHPNLIKGIVGIGIGIAGLVVGAKVIGVISAAFGVLSAVLLANPIGILLAVVAAGAALIYANWSSIKEVFSAIGSMFDTMPQDLRVMFAAMGADITGFFGGIWNFAKTTVVAGIAAITGVIAAWSPVSTMQAAFASTFAWFSELVGKFREFGSNLIAGLVSGITAKYEAVKKTIGGLVDTVKSAFTTPTKINSPSRLFMEYGGFISLGAQLGIERNAPRAIAAAGALALGVSGAWAGSGKGVSLQMPALFAPAAKTQRPVAQALQEAVPKWLSRLVLPVAGAGANSNQPGEQFTPTVPAQKFVASRAGIGAGATGGVQMGGNHYTFQIYQQPGEDQNALARRVMELIEQKSRHSRGAALGDWHGGT